MSVLDDSSNNTFYVSWILKEEIKIKLCIAPSEIAYVQ